MTELMLLMASPTEGSSPNPFLVFVPYLLILVIFYMMLIRPQQKRAAEHRKFLDSLKKGDAVVTDSGVFGTIASLHDEAVVLKVDDNVKIRILKAKLSGRAHEVAPEPARKTTKK